MSRRARAFAFGLTALVCAALAAAVAGGYGQSVSEQLGELRPVVVASSELPARRALTPRLVRTELELRRVPARFVPPGALSAPDEALGRAPAVRIPAGSFVIGEQLRLPRSGEPQEPRVGEGLSPLEIQVSGAGALAGAPGSSGRRVDVVVTSEPGPGGRGRTFVAARNVTLLALVEAGGADAADPGLSGTLPTYVATLGVTRAQALRLIDAENFAREVRLIPG